MKKLFLGLSISFSALLIINISWIIVNIYMFLVHGIESIVTGETLIENIYYSTFLRWLILLDLLWIAIAFGYMIKQKSYKTDSKLHFLQNSPLDSCKICVIMPTFNEEEAREELIDIWHFVIQASLELNLSPEDILKEYQRKNEINRQREKTGY